MYVWDLVRGFCSYFLCPTSFFQLQISCQAAQVFVFFISLEKFLGQADRFKFENLFLFFFFHLIIFQWIIFRKSCRFICLQVSSTFKYLCHN
jgi:hypothetical protein